MSRYTDKARGLYGDHMKFRNAILLAALVVVGCAKRPDAIVATEIPMAAYTSSGCEQIAQDMVKEQTNLAALSKQQNSAATGDAFGVFLVGVPASSVMGGDKEGLISTSKGKINAMDAAMKSKGCK